MVGIIYWVDALLTENQKIKKIKTGLILKKKVFKGLRFLTRHNFYLNVTDFRLSGAAGPSSERDIASLFKMISPIKRLDFWYK